MIKTKKWITGFLAGAALALAACNGGDGATAVSEGDLVAKWFFKSSSVKGFIRGWDEDNKEILRIPLDNDTTYTGNTYFIEFKTDKTYQANFPDEVGGGGLEKRSILPTDMETGTWSVSGNIVTTISSTAPPETSKVAASISGSNATFSISVNEKETEEDGSGYETVVDAKLTATK